jgi:hypothetical protein
MEEKYVRMTLIRVHGKFLWKNEPNVTNKEVIQVVTSLCDIGPVLVLRIVKNYVVMKLTGATFHGRDLTTKPISNLSIKYIFALIGQKIYFTN